MLIGLWRTGVTVNGGSAALFIAPHCSSQGVN